MHKEKQRAPNPELDRILETYDAYIKSIDGNYWHANLPMIPMRDGWKIKAIPAFGGCIVRYIITNQCGVDVSVYFDAYGQMGSMSEPYWEIHANNHDGDIQRFLMNDVEALAAAIYDFKPISSAQVNKWVTLKNGRHCYILAITPKDLGGDHNVVAIDENGYLGRWTLGGRALNDVKDSDLDMLLDTVRDEK